MDFTDAYLAPPTLIERELTESRDCAAHAFASKSRSPASHVHSSALLDAPAGRAKKIAALVSMLARGETIVPERLRTEPTRER